jgi:hypothetical protein
MPRSKVAEDPCALAPARPDWEAEPKTAPLWDRVVDSLASANRAGALRAMTAAVAAGLERRKLGADLSKLAKDARHDEMWAGVLREEDEVEGSDDVSRVLRFLAAQKNTTDYGESPISKLFARSPDSLCGIPHPTPLCTSCVGTGGSSPA